MAGTEEAEGEATASFVHRCGEVQRGAPACVHCGGPARPAVLLFGDDRNAVIDTQPLAEYAEVWRPRVRGALAAARETRLVVLEVGAGTAVPSVRNEVESYLEPHATRRQCTVVRINPTPMRGDNSTQGVLSIAWGAEEAIACIAARIRSLARAAAADAVLA